jgi:hypothetical protein
MVKSKRVSKVMPSGNVSNVGDPDFQPLPKGVREQLFKTLVKDDKSLTIVVDKVQIILPLSGLRSSNRVCDEVFEQPLTRVGFQSDTVQRAMTGGKVSKVKELSTYKLYYVVAKRELAHCISEVGIDVKYKDYSDLLDFITSMAFRFIKEASSVRVSLFARCHRLFSLFSLKN